MENNDKIIKNNAKILKNEDVATTFADRKRDTHKGDYGTVNIVSGSKNYLGASVLATLSALKSGCGYVKLTCSDHLKDLMLVKYPQVIYCKKIDKNASAIAIGMGGGVNKTLYNKICCLLNNYNGVLLIDADGLNCLAKYGLQPLKNAKSKVILTPHVKEFSRIAKVGVQEILNAPCELSRSFAKEYNLTLVLKSSKSIITDGENLFINERGSTALAKAGSGDMLSGFIAGICARGVSPILACAGGCYAMGVSAEICSAEQTDFCATANDIIKNLPKAIKKINKS